MRLAFHSFLKSNFTAIKLRKELPLLLERVGVRRIKIRKKALFDPLILTFSRREKGLYTLNLMAVSRAYRARQRDSEVPQAPEKARTARPTAVRYRSHAPALVFIHKSAQDRM